MWTRLAENHFGAGAIIIGRVKGAIVMALAALLAIAIIAVVAHRAPAGAGLITDDVIAASASTARRDARSACAALGTLTTGSGVSVAGAVRARERPFR